MTGKFRMKPRLHKRFSIRDTEKLITDWNNIHIEYWKSAYPQEGDDLICDGTQWSLFVRHEGARGVMFGGDNTYPENWNSLLAIFDIEPDEDEDLDDEDDEEIERQPGEVIYCKVFFNSASVSYYYQTEDENIEVGDRVIVPVGPNNAERVAVVESVEHYEPAKVPFPLGKTKSIVIALSGENMINVKTI